MASVETRLKVAQHLRGVFQELLKSSYQIKCGSLSQWYSQNTQDIDCLRRELHNRGKVYESNQLADLHDQITHGIAAFEVQLRSMGIHSHRGILAMSEEANAMEKELKDIASPVLYKLAEKEYLELMDRRGDIDDFYHPVIKPAAGAAKLIGQVIEALEECPKEAAEPLLVVTETGLKYGTKEVALTKAELEVAKAVLRYDPNPLKKFKPRSYGCAAVHLSHVNAKLRKEEIPFEFKNPEGFGFRLIRVHQ